MKTHFLKLGLLVALIFIIFNCSKPVPTQELVKARQSIEELQNRNPEGKSKEILDRAIQELKSAHEKLPEEDYDVSKKKAETSYQLARFGTLEWYPAGIENLKKAYQEKFSLADSANAEILAKEDFESSKSFSNEAEQILGQIEQNKLKPEESSKIENQNYNSEDEKNKILTKLEAILMLYNSAEDKYNKAIKSATIAYETSLTYKNEYFNQLKSLESKFNQAKQYNAEKYEPEKTALIQQRISEVNKQIDENQLKLAYKNLEELRNDINGLYALAISKYSQEKLKEAESTFQKTSGNVDKNKNILGQNASKINELMVSGKEALNIAKTDYASENYESTIKYSEEVLKICGVINDLIDQSNVAYKRNLALEEQKRREEEQKKKEQELAEEQAKKEQPTPSEENIKLIYTVKKTKPAESLWRIAGKKEIYNNPKVWRKIYEANKDQIKNPNLIYPGQNLKIPK